MTTTHDTTSAETASTDARPDELRYVDPRTLVDNPDNVRRSDRDREGLASSIKALGIIQPPRVRVDEHGALVLVAGERRKYSAIKAGLVTIPVVITDDPSPFVQVAGMFAENRNREDLTPVEEAAAVQKLAGFEGVTQRDIAAATGMKATEVRTALQVARSEVATAIGGRHDLNLAQLVVLAEFDTDPEAVKGLTVTAIKDPGRFDHLVAQLRRERDDRAAYQAAADQITAAEVRLVELDSGSWLPEDAAWLDELPAPKGRTRMTEAAHRSCPGHAAAVVESDDGYEVAYLCLDPIGCGHVSTAQEATPARLGAETTKPTGMTDEQKAERRLVIANNKAWEVATPVRRAYLAELLARRSVPKGTLRYVTTSILADPRGLAEGDDAMLATVTGKERDGHAWERTAARGLLADTPDARLALVLLAQVAASVEASFGDRQGWRRADRRLVAYLRFLTSTGYGLSEVEQAVVGTDETTEATPDAA